MYAPVRTIWLTGISGAGKTTLARGLEERFRAQNRPVELLDGDEIRKGLSWDLGYSRADRETHLRRIGFIANLLTSHNIMVIVAAISPYRAVRDTLRREIRGFFEVYCECPLSVAEQRDVKGLYKKARRGELSQFTGITDPYEEPVSPDVIVHTGVETVRESLANIWAALHGQ